MKALIILIVGFAALGIAGCSPHVHTDMDKTVDLSKYRSFKFIDGEDEAGPNPLYRGSLLENAIHAEIAREMEKRGYIEAAKNPGILIAYHTFTEKKESSVNNYYPMMYGGWGWRYYPLGFFPYPYPYWDGYTRIEEYTEGTLIIDMINPRNKQLMWRGSVSDAISDPGEIHRKATVAVRAIFRKFPVKSRVNEQQELKELNKRPITRR
jgi:hypothetical protein